MAEKAELTITAPELESYEQVNRQDWREQFVPFDRVIESYEADCLTIDSGWKKVNELARSYESQAAELIRGSLSEEFFYSVLEFHLGKSGHTPGTPLNVSSRRLSRLINEPMLRYVPQQTAEALMRSRNTALRKVYWTDDDMQVPYDDPEEFKRRRLAESHKAARNSGLNKYVGEDHPFHLQTAIYADLEVAAYGTFYEIECANKNVIRATGDYIAQSPEHFVSFVSWLKDIHESEDGTYRSYLTSIATDFFDEASERYIRERADTVLRDSDPRLEEVFVDSVLRDKESELGREVSAILGLMRLARGMRDEEYDAQAVFSSNAGIWPPSIREQYQAFSDAWKRNLMTDLKNTLSNYLMNARRIPSQERIDQYNQSKKPKLSGAPSRSMKRNGGGAARKKHKRDRGTNGRTTAPLLPEASQGKQFGDAILCVMKDSPSGCVLQEDTGDRISEMIKKYAESYQHEPQLVEALHAQIRLILEDPKGPGSRKLINQTVNIDGQPSVPLRRFSPQKNPYTESSGNTAYRTRIIYSVLEDEGRPRVAIREILHHSDFDSKYLS